MRRSIALSVLALAAVGVTGVAAQAPVTVRSAVLFEQYDFDPGLSFVQVSELTVPVAINASLGSRAALAISSGYASVELTSGVPGLANQTISGMLDTQARLTIQLVPGRLLFITTGSIPTGTKTVQPEELSILGALASDVIGFSASNLGTGGTVGGGIAGAVPVGKYALGFGATFRRPLSYDPVATQTRSLQPGAEFRLRGGFEGPIARTTYIRIAGIWARTMKDQVNGATQNGIGNRLIGYVSLNHGVGPASITVYGFDVFRGDPQVEATATGAALLPRGNLIAGGARIDLAVARGTTFSPRGEYRRSTAAPNATASDLEFLGRSTRVGADLRQNLARGLDVILQGSGVFGKVARPGAAGAVSFSGYRLGLHLEVRP